MSDPRETVRDAAGEKFATPDCSVVTVAGAVEAQAEHPAAPLFSFGEHGSDVRAMVLDAAPLRTLECRGVMGPDILRVRIVDY